MEEFRRLVRTLSDVTNEFRILADRFWDLTPRQREVAKLLAKGHDRREIASITGMTTNNVSTQFTSLRRRWALPPRRKLANSGEALKSLQETARLLGF